MVADVRAHRKTQLAERMAASDDPGPVFTTCTGHGIDAANLRRLVRGGDSAGVGHVTPCDLRHTATSVLSAAGVPNEHLADLLGHVDSRIVERHYRHRLGDSVAVAAGPKDELFPRSGVVDQAPGVVDLLSDVVHALRRGRSNLSDVVRGR